MSQGFSRCEFMSPQSGLQCEVWFESPERQRDKDGNLLPILCKDHSTGASVENNRTQYIETVNVHRLYCDKMNFDELDAHIAKIETEIENQKTLLYAARAVRADKLSNLSEDERKERLKYKVKKAADNSAPKAPTLAKDPVGYLSKKGLDTQKAKDLLSMDPAEFLKKYAAAKVKKDEKK